MTGNYRVGCKKENRDRLGGMYYRKLIINADDFGLSQRINEGIVECHINGVVTSTSIMMTMPMVNHALKQAEIYPDLDVGLHIDLTWGIPLSEPSKIPHIVNSKGKFVGKKKLLFRLLTGKVPQREIEYEILAQVRKFKQTGLVLYHVDVHQHLLCIPIVMKTLMSIASREKIPFVRLPFEKVFSNFTNVFVTAMLQTSKKHWLSAIKRTDHFVGLSLTNRLDEKTLIQILKRLEFGITELLCHPGFDDPTLYNISRLKNRKKEINALTSERVKRFIQSQQIELITFRKLYNKE